MCVYIFQKSPGRRSLKNVFLPAWHSSIERVRFSRHLSAFFSSVWHCESLSCYPSLSDHHIARTCCRFMLSSQEDFGEDRTTILEQKRNLNLEQNSKMRKVLPSCDTYHYDEKYTHLFFPVVCLFLMVFVSFPLFLRNFLKLSHKLIELPEPWYLCICFMVC